MPNQFAARYIGAAGMSIPGTTPVGTFRGMRIPASVHRISAGSLARQRRILPQGHPGRHPVVDRMSGYHTRGGRSGLGVIGAGFSIGASIASAVSNLASVIGTIVSAIADVIKTIATFIVDIIGKIVTAVMGAVGTLVESVVSMIVMKEDGDVNFQEAIQMGGFLMDKAKSFLKAPEDKGMDRPMTAEEKAGFENQQRVAQKGILDHLSSGASAIVGAVGGPVQFGLLSLAAGGLVYFGMR